ncbi:metallophosphoesterase family protein [Deinococcus hopiensis]|uniref:Predicted phosphodiesterase n=1 Tax=Deinococcus hopiensis KR-140 TaxID=695939 RepID=A0A1W1V540_9DEIO|nr:metallophosphoesterase [Deinococcus hopiensis]SMB88468.1 Predicted phosphodiesterase [Deinococcus hopiensis KR-140]
MTRYDAGVRLLLLSDIHANYPALEAVLKDAEPRHFDAVVHLGDALGYGPFPREVLNTLRDIDATCLLGNHEQMLLEYADNRREKRDSVVSAPLLWQLARLSKLDLALIRGWRDGVDDPALGARFRHGTPVSLDVYTDSVPAARDAFARWQGRLGFVGHTHVAAVYATLNAPVGEWIKVQPFPEGGSYLVPPSARLILNPGSVGQPRDGNPNASYGIYDSARGLFEVFRVPYNVERTQEAILAAGLPPVLATRLAIGK